jgi:Uma2 family endonuclease
VATAYAPHHFTRAEYYAIADSLNPNLHYELLNGTIYAVSPANPPHAGVVTFFTNRFLRLDLTRYMLRVQKPLEIEPDGAPEPDVAIVDFRADYYGTSHPTGTEAHLVIEVGDTERKPREKMRDYMLDGRISSGWRIDLPNRCIEIWAPMNTTEPVAVLDGAHEFTFDVVTFTVDELFRTVLHR